MLAWVITINSAIFVIAKAYFDSLGDHYTAESANQIEDIAKLACIISDAYCYKDELEGML